MNPPSAVSYIPLHMHSHYSFLDSVLSPAEAVGLALRGGCEALALTDTGNLHGAVPFVQAAIAAGLRPLVGAELAVDGKPLLLYAEDQGGYTHLCRLLTHAGGAPGLSASVLAEQDRSGLVAVGADPALAAYFPGAFYLGAGTPRARYSGAGDLPIVAVPAAHYPHPADRRQYEIVQSIRTRTLLGQPHPLKRRGPLHFRTPETVREAFRDHPDWIARTREIADRCRFAFTFGRLHFPAFHPPDGSTPHAFLRARVLEGIHAKYGSRPALRQRVRRQVEQELAMIAEVGYEEYFLVVWDLLQTCRERGIEWITRGSAADSLVCYCLDISDVCPIRFDLYFQRFLNRERMQMNKLPDIDIDFAHDRKDDVVDLLFDKYGAEHTAVVGGFSTFRSRSALADAAKVLGVADHQVRRLTQRLPYHSRPSELRETVQQAVQCRDLPVDEEPYATALAMAAFLDGVPRNPKMHPCGVVLSREPIMTLSPCFPSAKGYPTTHFDMDAVEDVGLIKLDILAQGGLAVLRDVSAGLRSRGETIDLRGLEPWEDPAVWDLVSSGQARAVHHIESPAMISLARMCNVRDIDTLVAMVSVIRPGAANQKKKQHFTLRYQGLEPVDYPHPSLEQCLRDTFGMLVYEEQVLQICDAFAGMPPGDADRLRRALNKRNWEQVQALGWIFYRAALARGRTREEMRAVWTFLLGFNGYAFCKAHSTAYGVEAYQSAWLKHNHPAEFMASVLTHGKGFYSRLVYILECYRLGLRLWPPRVTDPGPGYQVRDGNAIRTPVAAIKGLAAATLSRLHEESRQAPFSTLADFYRRVHPTREDFEILLRVGALDDLDAASAGRTGLFWQIQWLLRSFGDPAQPTLFAHGTDPILPPVARTEPTRAERLEAEHDLLGFTVTGHPLDRYPGIAWETYCPVAELHRHLGHEVVCCGLVVIDRVVVHDTGESMKFMTLTDYTGMVETELFAHAYRKFGLATVRYPVLEVHATVEPFANANGFTLNVHQADRPRRRKPESPANCLS